jgi:hypothetical protein
MDVRKQILTVGVERSIACEGMDVKKLEEICWEAARELFAELVRGMQEWYHREEGKGLERREWKSRGLLTRLGWVELAMLKVRDRESGKTFQLGSRLLDLGDGERATEWVKRKGVELRVRGLTYRGAGGHLGEMLGCKVSGMWVWRWVQEKGRERCVQEGEEKRKVFEGKREEVKPPRHLYLEADEIHVKAQRSGVKTHRVKVGLSYTGRSRKSIGRRERRRLEGKHVYGGVESLSDFGGGWYSALEAWYGISEAKGVLYLTDGDVGLRNLGEEHFPQAIHQLDWRHVFQAIRGGAPDERRYGRWVDQLCCGELKRACQEMRSHVGRGLGNAELLGKVVGLLERQGEAFYGWKEYRRLHDVEREEWLPRGTGGIEKNQEVTIGRTMKRRGMAWTETGANHLAKLIFAWQEKDTWESLWRSPSPPLT